MIITCIAGGANDENCDDDGDDNDNDNDATTKSDNTLQAKKANGCPAGATIRFGTDPQTGTPSEAAYGF